MSNASIATRVKWILARRAKWAEALRSGKYEQTVGQLQITQEMYDNRVADVVEDLAEEVTEEEVAQEIAKVDPCGFCCLGVASRVAVKSRILSASNYKPDDGGARPEVAEWLGLDEDGEGATSIVGAHWTGAASHAPYCFATLASLNDAYHYNFDEIADLIEEPGVLRIFVDGEEVEDPRVAA